MKICLVTQQYKNVRSGVGVYANNYVGFMKTKEHELTVIVPSGTNFKNERNVEFIEVKKLPFDPSPGKFISFSFFVWKKMREKINEYDLIHFTDAKEAVFFNSIPILSVGNINDCYLADCKKNLLFYLKNYPFDWFARFNYYNLFRIFEKKALNNLDLIISNTIYVKDKIVEKYKINSSKVKVIYKSIDLGAFKKEYLNHEKRVNNVLFIGGNFQRKGLLKLIMAAPVILKSVPDVKFLIVGEDRNINKFIKLVKQKDLDKHFSFIGKVEYSKIRELHKTARALVVPSLVEAFGLVYLEAMAMGVPVVGSKIGGTKELIQDSVNGYLVNPYDIDEIANKVIKILTLPKIRKLFVEEGYKTVKSYVAGSMLNETEKEYLKRLHFPIH